MKKESNNKLVCQITGNERISNATYLTDKAYKYGVSVVEWKAFYVSKSALGPLKSFVASFDVANAAAEYSRTEEDIKKMVSYNGGGGFLLRLAEQEVKGLEKAAAQVNISTGDASVALELATAEIERTKEALITKNETSERDRKLARRRELYAENKRTTVTA